MRRLYNQSGLAEKDALAEVFPHKFLLTTGNCLPTYCYGNWKT